MIPFWKKSRPTTFVSIILDGFACVWDSGWLTWWIDRFVANIITSAPKWDWHWGWTSDWSRKLVACPKCVPLVSNLKYLDKSDNCAIKRVDLIFFFIKWKFYKNLRESQIPQYPASKLHFSERLRCTLCENVFGCCSYLLHFLYKGY